MQYSMKYIFGFAAVLCFVCSILISSANVGLRERQEINKKLDKQKSVLQAAWLVKPGEKATAAEVERIFQNVKPHVVDLASGEVLADVDPESFDEAKEAQSGAPENNAGIKTVPGRVKTYEVVEDGKTTMIILPIYGKGLWSTMKGFLALDADGTTVRGLTYYEQAETPGLGGEVENPRWKQLWQGRKAFGDDGAVKIAVIKGPAGNPESDPHHVDGLSGATITSRGVTNMLQYWLGDKGFGPYLKKFRESRQSAA